MIYTYNHPYAPQNLGDCPNCGHSITDHLLLDDYELCEDCAQHAQAEADVQRQLEMMCECSDCGTLIVSGDYCEVCQNRRAAEQHKAQMQPSNATYFILFAQIEARYPQQCLAAQEFKRELLTLRLFAQTGDFNQYAAQLPILKRASGTFFVKYPNAR